MKNVFLMMGILELIIAYGMRVAFFFIESERVIVLQNAISNTLLFAIALFALAIYLKIKKE